MRALAWLFPLLLLTFHSQSSTPSTAPQTAQDHERPLVKDSDEYAVYSVILNAEQPSPKIKQFVINKLTMSEAETPCLGLIGGMTFSGAKVPTVDPTTMSDYTEKRKKSGLLDKRFSLTMPYVLAADEELRALFVLDKDGRAGDDSWAPFYQQYPGAAGIIVLSRVGFNEKKDQALVYVVQQTGMVGGVGRILVLSKSGDTWKIVKDVQMWLS